MKINSVIIKDQKAKIFFGFIRQFPGICAQSDTFEGVREKINKYFKKYVERMKNEKN